MCEAMLGWFALKVLQRMPQVGSLLSRSKTKFKIGNGTKGQLRCAMGMCSNQCLLKHTGKLSAECQKCVEKFCPLVSAASSSCIAAENNKEPAYNFCTNIMDCNKGGVGPVAAHVTGLACTKNTACCTWDI